MGGPPAVSGLARLWEMVWADVLLRAAAPPPLIIAAEVTASCDSGFTMVSDEAAW